VVNVLFNGVFAYLYDFIASESSGCLNWLLPEDEGDAGLACVRLGQRNVFKDASRNHEFSLLGPMIVATIAYFVKCTPWHTFHGMIDKPAFECWFADFLRFYKRWLHEAVACQVMEVVKAFY
jgi:hypothetical protein